MSFSVVLPVCNEQEYIAKVYNELDEILTGNYELIFVDDGSSDSSLTELQKIKAADKKVLLKALGVNKGQSWATFEGIKLAKYDKIVIMDSDGQYDPRDIQKLLNELTETTSLVSGKRDNRKDSFLYRTASHFGNKWISSLFGLPKFDLGCGLKVAYKDDLLKLPYFKHIHRYYQIIYHFSGLKVKSIEINHRERVKGKSKYSLMKIFNIIPRIIWLKIKKPKLNL